MGHPECARSAQISSQRAKRCAAHRSQPTAWPEYCRLNVATVATPGNLRTYAIEALPGTHQR